MSAITGAAHTRLVLLCRAMDSSERNGNQLVHVEDGLRYRDAVTMAALLTGQSYEDIDAAIRTEVVS